MWVWIREIWAWVEELGTNVNGNKLSQRVYGIMLATFLIALFTVLGFGEWVREKMDGNKSYPHLSECIKCRDGFDRALADYPMATYFCPNCLNAVGRSGLSLVGKFTEWFAVMTKYKNPNGDGIALSVFNALTSKAPREKLIDALNHYADNKITDLMGFGELLEEYDNLIKDKK